MRGWNNNEQSDNFILRNSCISHLNLDIIGIAESHLMKNETLSVEGYQWFGQNRDSLHVNARKGSGGVGFLIRNGLLNHFNVCELNSAFEGILWLSLKSKTDSVNFNICVCYLPPLNSSRQIDAQKFYDCLLANIYEYQNHGRILYVAISIVDAEIWLILSKALTILVIVRR